jgi:3,4-dihydroxy 2-butanone 4-phosphate synthase/GTP cyclohydrolase II
MCSARGERAALLPQAMEMIGAAGAGVVVMLTGAGTPDPFTRELRQREGADSGMDELRDYGVGAQILTELGVHDMILLTNSHHILVALDGYGLSIVGERPIAPVEA